MYYNNYNNTTTSIKTYTDVILRPVVKVSKTLFKSCCLKSHDSHMIVTWYYGICILSYPLGVSGPKSGLVCVKKQNHWDQLNKGMFYVW